MSFNVILSGSTGNLGAYLLDELLSLPQIDQVICLNRAENAGEKQGNAHTVRGLTQPLDASRVQFFTADFTAPQLALAPPTYAELAQHADVFIHNAWPVDFNRNVRSFRPLIEGMAYLVEFCKSRTVADNSAHPMKLLFVSSIGATSNWDSAAPTSRSEVPEVEILDWKVARTGYGQSKLLSERLLCHAAATFAIPVAIVRVGQLCGPVRHDTKGKWPEREWIPSIIKSSMALNALPETLGPTEVVDWVPADVAAQVIVDIVAPFVRDELLGRSRRTAKATRKMGKDAGSAHFFHIVNPRPSQWKQLVPAMRERMSDGMKTVSFVEWVDLLKASVAEAGGFQGVNEGLNPAGKLIDFFDNLQDRAIRFPHARVAPLETVQTQKVSATLRELEAVRPEWMDLFLRQWGWDEVVDMK